ncbi:protein of unknown function [Paraburkholderia kururiensis]|uniref:hypothetical protein n=1 Tax=Paraburkholderia kururiensis TaxID=984307 RepID=UPI0039A64DA7
MRIQPVDATNDIEHLQATLEGASRYSLTVVGKLPAPNAAIKVLDARPPGKNHSDKFVFEIPHDVDAVGCIEMVRGYRRITAAIRRSGDLVNHETNR